MKSIGIQVIQPKTDLAPEGVKDAIIDRISNNASDTKGLSISVVRFPRGVRRPWSSHAQDQYAWIISGKGIISSEEGETELYAGNLVFIPANTRHQHGASDEDQMAQLSIIGGTEPRGTRVDL
jgi:quercetin dioxygenase-like cupin family protein